MNSRIEKKLEMKRIVLFSLALALVACSCGKKQLKQDALAIEACFTQYKVAILNNNGQEAIKYIDKTTVDYYAEMVECAKTIKSTELQKLSFLDKLMVLSLRHRATAEQLNSFTGESVLVWAVEQGMIGKESVQNITIGKVDIEGLNAKGQFVNLGQATPFYYEFNKENDAWKIDLTSIFKVSEKALLQAARMQGMNSQEFIYYMLEMVTGEEVDPNIWYRMVE